MQMWVFRLLAGVADAFGNDEPNDDPATDHEGQKQKNQTKAGVGFIHRII